MNLRNKNNVPVLVANGGLQAILLFLHSPNFGSQDRCTSWVALLSGVMDCVEQEDATDSTKGAGFPSGDCCQQCVGNPPAAAYVCNGGLESSFVAQVEQSILKTFCVT